MDLKNLQVTGTGIPVLDEVSGLQPNGFSQWAVSRSGTLAYVPGSGKNDKFTLNFMDLSGKIEPVPAPTTSYQAPVRPSPDGTRLLVRITEGTSTNLALFDLSTRRTTRLTFLKGGAVGSAGTWTPDSKHIVFGYSGTELNGPGVYWIRSDGGGEAQRLTEGFNIPWSFSPDGKRFAYYAGPGTGSDQFGLWTVPLNLDDPEHPKAGAPELYLKASAIVQYPAFSPDGHWIAYSSAETGRMQVYVRPFVPGAPATGGKWQISSTLGAAGFWLPNHELLFVSQSSSGIVGYTTNPDSFVAGPIRPVLEKPTATNGLPIMMPDGKRFVVVLQDASTAAAQQTHVSFLLNFPDELERRVSAGTSK
jgi:Tol biopolymer transport system component